MSNPFTDAINTIVSPIRTAINAIKGAFSAMWNTITGFFRSLGRVFSSLGREISGWAGSVVRNAEALFHTIGYFFTTYLPNAISHTVDTITSWVSGLIHNVSSFVSHLFNTVVSWVGNELSSIGHTISGIWTSITGEISKIWATLSRVADLVFRYLGDAGRLAEWAVSSIYDALVKFVKEHASAIGTEIWNARGTIYDWFVHLMEDFLSTIL